MEDGFITRMRNKVRTALLLSVHAQTC